MRHSSTSLLGTGLLLGLLLAMGARAASAQEPKEPAPPASSTAPSDSKPAETSPKPTTPPKVSKDAATRQPDERQQKLEADTEKLYEMIQDLKAEVARSSKDTLSVSVVKKAAEIEKLAKNLKERMRKE